MRKHTYFQSPCSIIVCYSSHGLNYGPFNDQPIFDHLNTELNFYSYSHCTTIFSHSARLSIRKGQQVYGILNCFCVFCVFKLFMRFRVWCFYYLPSTFRWAFITRMKKHMSLVEFILTLRKREAFRLLSPSVCNFQPIMTRQI